MASEARWEGLLEGTDWEAVDSAGPVPVLIGIHALNQARSVAQVAAAAVSGLSTLEGDLPAAVIVMDGGSRDATLEAAGGAAKSLPPRVRLHGVRTPGAADRGRAIQALLGAALRLKVAACALVDAGLLSLSPEGARALVLPVLRGEADYVSPAYSHAVSEGTLTTNVLAPVSRALFGRRVQQIMGGCAALSGTLIERLAEREDWDGGPSDHGTEIWLAVESLLAGDRIAEAHLGRKRMDAGPAPADLTRIVVGCVGPLLHLVGRHHERWMRVRGSAPTVQAGEAPALLPGIGEASVERMVRAFKLGLKDLLPVWEQAMPEETLGQLYPLGLLGTEEFEFPPRVWARVVYDFALAYEAHRLPREHLLRALIPLYLGRVAAFLAEARREPVGRLPVLVEMIGQAFEAERNYLTTRWR